MTWEGSSPERWVRADDFSVCDKCGYRAQPRGGNMQACLPNGTIWRKEEKGRGSLWCSECMDLNDCQALFGCFSEEESLPPIAIVGVVRSGTTLLTRLMRDAGIWMGHQGEDPYGFWLAGEVVRQVDMGHLIMPTKVDYEAADHETRQLGPGFLDMHRRPFPWGWKYYSHHWGMNGWLDLCPDGKFVAIWRNEDPWVESVYALGGFTREEIRVAAKKNKDSIMRFVDNPQVCVMHYDTLITDPKGELERLAKFLSPIVEVPGNWHQRVNDRRMDGTSRFGPALVGGSK